MIRYANLLAVHDALRAAEGPLSIADLVEATGLSRPTVYGAVAALEADGAAVTERVPGRKRTSVRLGAAAMPPPPPRDQQPDRTAAMLQRYRDGLTLEAIAAEYGLTRERVRQLLTVHAEYHELRDARQAAARRAAAERALAAAPPPRPCRLCGTEFTPHAGLGRYCCEDHRRMHHDLRYHLVDDSRRTDHLRSMAKTYLARPEHYGPERVRWAERTLAGLTTDRGRRWVVEGSKAHLAATEAYRKGWAIFGRLHPDLQARIRAENPGTPGTPG